MTLHEKLTSILGVPVEKGKIREAIKRVDVSGGVTNRILIELIILILTHIEGKSSK